MGDGVRFTEEKTVLGPKYHPKNRGTTEISFT